MKIVGNFFDRRADFFSIVYNRNDGVRTAPPVAKPAGLNLDMQRTRRAAIADDRVERPELLCRSMRSSKKRRPVTSCNAIEQREFATHRPPCDAKVPLNQQLVFIVIRGALMCQLRWNAKGLFMKASRAENGRLDQQD